MPVQLTNIVPWGRSFDEYVQMFALTEDDLNRPILDCAAGPSSFTAEMHARGHHVISADPLYEFSPTQIRSRVAAVRDDMLRQVRNQLAQFVWTHIRSPEHLEQLRIGAMDKFLEDFSTDPDHRRYRPTSLPNLDFPDNQFDLALCSHFLFLYSDHLDATFHISAIRELLRLAPEVRIFPITDLGGRPSPHLQKVRDQFETNLLPVPYEFLKGANQMLVARR